MVHSFMIEARCPHTANEVHLFNELSNEAVELFIKYVYLDVYESDLASTSTRALFEVWRLAIDLVCFLHSFT